MASFLRDLGKAALEDDLDDVAAMLAYYTILAAFPMLVFVVGLAVAVLPTSALTEGMYLGTRAFPVAIQQLLMEYVATASKGAAAGFAIGGAAFALFGASRAAVALMNALNRVHGYTETRSWIRRQLTAIGVTLVVALIALVALALLVAGPIAGHWIADRFLLGDAFDVAWEIGRWIGTVLLVNLLWAFAYWVLPNTQQRFRWFSPGTAIGIAIWVGISLGFQLYVQDLGSYEVTYGAVGTGIILLTWIWLTNLAFLLGAEIDDVISVRRAVVYSPRSPAPAARPSSDRRTRAGGVRTHASPVPGA